MSDARVKFQGLLRELFQFDCADLDFGIYRIMNQKRAVIERFIENDLMDAVGKKLRKGALKEQGDLAEGLLNGKQVFLLRNLSRGKGIGFFEGAGFYPDFILWVKSGKTQRIIFVEPHGMLHETLPQANEKVGLHRKLQADAGPALKKLSGVSVDAFVVSRTPYDTLRKKWVHDHGSAWTRKKCATEHVLFPERGTGYDYIAEILRASDVT